MSKLTGTEVGSYAGAVASIGASLTLTEIGVIVGIFTALATFAVNMYFAYRRDQREQMETEARLKGKA